MQLFRLTSYSQPHLKCSLYTIFGITRRIFRSRRFGRDVLSPAKLPMQARERPPQETTAFLHLIFNLGAPIHIDICDRNPDAGRRNSGPFQRPFARPVPTSKFSELLPLHANLADNFSLRCSCYHTAPAAMIPAIK